MIDLDDQQQIVELDAEDMLGAIGAMGDDCATAYELGRSAEGLLSVDAVTAVTFCGMGGSAVAGDLLRSVFRDRLGVPVEVNRNPELPHYCGPTTLVVASSYSGETSETLACFRQAVDRGCQIIAVASGGSLYEAAVETGVPAVLVPGGAQPRAALGHLGFATLGALESSGLLPHLGNEVTETAQLLNALSGELAPMTPRNSNPAKQLVDAIGDRVPVTWGADGIGSVAAMRWKTQFNENGKIPAWWSSMSELDHNEIVGWTGSHGDRSVVIALRHAGESAELEARFRLSEEIAVESGALVREVIARGDTPLQQLMWLVMLGDFTSAYVGLRRGIDPSPVDTIMRLKAALVQA